MNYHKGFIVPLILIIIAILLAGSGAYVYMQSKTIVQGQSNCTDYNSGKDIYVKGGARTFNSKGTIYAGDDTCATSNDGPSKYTTGLPSCSGNNCYVNKNYCGNYQGSLIVQHEFVQCPHGCADGACIK